MEPRCFVNPYEDFDPASAGVMGESGVKFVEGLIQKFVKVIVNDTDPKKHSGKSRPDLYVGSAGIAFMFNKLANSPLKDKLNALDYAKIYSDAANRDLKSNSRKPISLLSGDAGVHAVSAAVKKTCSEDFSDSVKKLLAGMSCYEEPDYLEDGADEMLVGRCGFVLGILWLNRQLESEILPDTEMQKLAKVMLASGRRYSRRHKLKVPLMYQYHGREYLGAAHGVSAILLSLLMLPLSQEDLADVKATTDAILALQDEAGNFPSKFDKLEAHLVHWCHGAPGVVYLMARAYLTFGEAKYLESCLKCGDLTWSRGLLRKGPGICHVQLAAATFIFSSTDSLKTKNTCIELSNSPSS